MVTTSQAELNFSHDYYKLRESTFTTIRGKTHPQRKNFSVGDLVRITVKRELRMIAQIMNIDLKRIQDIPLPLLQADANYPGFKIMNVTDFLHLLNSFQRFHQYTSESEVSIYSLEEVPPEQWEISRIDHFL